MSHQVSVMEPLLPGQKSARSLGSFPPLNRMTCFGDQQLVHLYPLTFILSNLHPPALQTFQYR